ncbi:hypothetical protein B566_EDAN013006 [Ephemera danica]|nr:hypothetical protein B566_EDAN013006 [Ephemera danica]
MKLRERRELTFNALTRIGPPQVSRSLSSDIQKHAPLNSLPSLSMKQKVDKKPPHECNKTVDIYEDVVSPPVTPQNEGRPFTCFYRLRSYRGTPKDWVIRVRFKKFKFGTLVNASTCIGGHLQLYMNVGKKQNMGYQISDAEGIRRSSLAKQYSSSRDVTMTTSRSSHEELPEKLLCAAVLLLLLLLSFNKFVANVSKSEEIKIKSITLIYFKFTPSLLMSEQRSNAT